jgi:hypothetical protein
MTQIDHNKLLKKQNFTLSVANFNGHSKMTV